MELKQILIIDEDTKFTQSLRDDPLFNRKALIIVESTTSQAITYIKKNAKDLIGIFISPQLANPGSLSVIKIALTKNPLLPIYYIETMSSDFRLTSTDKKLGVVDAVAKPFKVSDLYSKLSVQLNFFDSSKALKLSNNDKIDVELDEIDPAFTPIKIEYFISGSQSLFDIYVKLRKDKYIKILQAGDKFDASRIDYYLEKNVRFLYIRDEAQTEYIRYCDTLSDAILNSDGLDLGKKYGHLINQSELTINYVNSFGVDNESIAYVQKFVKKTISLISELSNKDDVFKELLSSISSFTHASSVIVFAGLICKELGLDSEQVNKSLGIATLLHDIAFSHPEVHQDLDYGNVGKVVYKTEEEIQERLNNPKCFAAEKNKLQKIFNEHAWRGAEIVEQSKSISALTVQIIAQHHSARERQLGLSSATTVHPLASILEASDELTHFFASKGQNIKDLKPFRKDLMAIANKYPQAIKEALLSVLTPSA